jgi:hypothetical protein
LLLHVASVLLQAPQSNNILAKRRLTQSQLTDHEAVVMRDVIDPDMLDVTFATIGGLERTQIELKVRHFAQ